MADRTEAPTRIAIIISGSRRLRSDEHRGAIRGYLLGAAAPQLSLTTKNARTIARTRSHIVVIHGAQKGADEIADEEGRSLGLDSWGIPYFGELDDPAKGLYPGGPKRNKCVVDVACVLRDTGIYRVIMGAFPDAYSRGTYSAVRYAQSCGLAVDIMKQER